MTGNKALFFVLVLAAFSFSSCSGPLTSSGCTSNCSGTTTVSVTLVADTLPANPSILSFKVSIISITLTPTSGTAQIFTPASPIVVDLMRLQSDTAYLGTLSNLPSGTYTVQVSLSSPELVFFNDTTSTIMANGVSCAPVTTCSVAFGTVGVPVIGSFSFTANPGGKQGFGMDFNLKNALSLSNGTLTVNFAPTAPNPAVLSAFTLPRANANLAANELELIEDFTGVVSINTNNITITSPIRGAITGSAANAFFDASPDGTICPTPATISCAIAGQLASVDAILNSDGTLSIKEFEPLLATQQDFVEGVVFSINSPTQFGIAITDKVQLATGSLIGGLNTGSLLTVNLAAGVKPFQVDSKGLAVQNSFGASFGLFANQTSTSAIHPGQAVAIHVVSPVTAAGPTTLASATADTVILRWSRLRPNVVSATSFAFNVNSLPTYFGMAPSSQEVVQAFLTGALGGPGVTNLDGVVLNAAGLTVGQPVGLRVLYLQSPTNTANPAFFAAKIRKP